MPRLLLLSLTLLLLPFIAACGGNDAADDSLEALGQADSFATYYFNWRYVDAARFATAESLTALSFMASNVTDSDIVALRQKPEAASVSLGEPVADTDSTLTIPVEASNFLELGKIGQGASLRQKGNYELQLVKRNGQWLVDLRHPLAD